MILPNGLEHPAFAALHEFQNLHQQYKERIHEFVMGHFFPSYTFDLDNTLYFFTSGRYEYRNKGMDLFIEALSRLNQRLKDVARSADGRRVHHHPAPIEATSTSDVLQNQSMFDDLRNTCEEISEQMGQRAVPGQLPTGACRRSTN